MIAEDDNMPVVGWHRDSYPFVCVLMMSDTAGMVGGETALRTGTGEIMKVRGPSKVSYRKRGLLSTPLLTLPGLRCHLARPVYRTPGPPSFWVSRTYHIGHKLSPKRPSHS